MMSGKIKLTKIQKIRTWTCSASNMEVVGNLPPREPVQSLVLLSSAILSTICSPHEFIDAC